MRLERSYAHVDGVDPTDAYVRTFWLPLLGPSSFVMIGMAEAHRMPWETDSEDLAARLGVKAGVALSACERLVRFRIWDQDGADQTFLVPERVRLLTLSDARKLPDPLPQSHADLLSLWGRESA